MPDQQSSMDSLDFVTRHSIKPKGDDLPSAEYPGVSEKGVDLAKERAEQILQDIEQLPEGAVLVMSGVSELVRTRSTMEAYGDELARLVKESGREDIQVMNMDDLRALGAGEDGEEKPGMTKMLDAITAEITSHPDKKYVVIAPLQMKEFFGKGRFFTNEGGLNDYTKVLLEMAGNSEQVGLRMWLENQGKLDGYEGPNPAQVAHEQLTGIGRLRSFVKWYLPDRPVSVGIVGHSWNTDALAVALANNGEVTVEGFDKLGIPMVKETQMVRIEVSGDTPRLVYGDVSQEIDPQLVGLETDQVEKPAEA